METAASVAFAFGAAASGAFVLGASGALALGASGALALGASGVLDLGAASGVLPAGLGAGREDLGESLGIVCLVGEYVSVG